MKVLLHRYAFSYKGGGGLGDSSCPIWTVVDLKWRSCESGKHAKGFRDLEPS